MNRKRIYRLWQREGFQVPKKQRKKRRLGSSANSCVRRRAEHKDHVWAWDFIYDRTANGRPLKWFAITDEYTRECLALEVDRGMTAERCAGRAARLVRDSWRAEVHSQRQRPGVHCPGDSPVSGEQASVEHTVHRAGLALGERLCGELPQPAAERVARRGRSSRTWRRPSRSRLRGAATTTTSGRTAVWITRPPPSSPPRVLLPLRLRLRSSSTREDKKHYPFPNPYSHNPWYKKWGQVSGFGSNPSVLPVAGTNTAPVPTNASSPGTTPDSSPIGYTQTGIPEFVGPRGGVYHYSKNGNKVYDKH